MLACKFVIHTICLLISLASISAFAAELVISKSKRSLEYKSGTLSRHYNIALGKNSVGAKLKQGDKKTPEGVYYITHKNPNSQFHLSIGISYPNASDANKGLRTGLISKNEYLSVMKALQNKQQPPQHTKLGGDIFIHGGGASRDWTWGCVALNNADIEFLFKYTNIGDKVTITQ